jgi:Rrf2 family protein
MNLNKSSLIGLYAAVMMAERPSELVSAAEVAETHGVSENHAAKVLQQLARRRLTNSVRGASGGYQLAVDPKVLTMLDIVEALEGPLETEAAGGGTRSEDPSRGVRGVLAEIAEQAYFTLKSVSIASLVDRRGPS